MISLAVFYFISVLLSYAATRYALIKGNQDAELSMFILVFIPLANIPIIVMTAVRILEESFNEEANKLFFIKKK